MPKNFLAGYSGYIQADGYNGHKFINDEEKQTRVGCWAHARRKFIDSIKAAGKNAEPGVAHKAVRCGCLYHYLQHYRNRESKRSGTILVFKSFAEKPSAAKNCR
ncbi:MAG: hypothetical protein Kow0029_08980 [Candidatus Rifleibacteriota bacterium]